ncbi:MAG: gamma-glutamyl-gamma-aminobutyrate hydrolase family protein [Bacteroidetes bacterium]|nr:gamma-glutamyl-gamma-aminobutyrate hydrolase family protein [Bacteroidota bacterium]
MSKKIVIGITDCEKYSNYEKWILHEPDVEVIRLGHTLSNVEKVATCDAILLTGGDDIHPRFYNNNDIHYPNAPDKFVEDRDEFEMNVFAKAQENKLPVLGVCRGLQLINCALDGTLKQDLGKLNETHTRILKEDKIHQVEVSNDTLLQKITKINEGEVNSSHHQAIGNLGKGLTINCRAADGTIEGIERSEKGQPFLMAVQWHPERMADQSSPLSLNIKKTFLESIRK